MVDRTEDDRRIVLYLLGDLPEAEQIEVERRFFSDDRYFEQLLAFEDELTYDYLRGDLSPDERVKFERRLLPLAASRKSTAFAEALLQALKPAASVRRWIWPPPLMRLSLAAVAAVLVSGLVMTRREVATLRADLFAQRTELARRTELPAPVSPTFHVSFVLTPGLVRGQETRRLRIPPGPAEVELQLVLRQKPAAQTYGAALRTPEGVEVWSQTGLRPAPGDPLPMVNPVIPASVFTPGDYELILKASTPAGDLAEAGDYYFAVVK